MKPLRTPYTIGLIDSGVGGLYVLKELKKVLAAHFIYLADTANMPYGTKSPDEIKVLGTAAIQTMQHYNPDCIIIACHTLSAFLDLAAINRTINIPCIGMIDAIAQAATHHTKNNRIAILGTTATIASNAHARALKQYNRSIFCYELACPNLASIIENNPNDAQLIPLAQKYAKLLRQQNVDTIILGCTHFQALHDILSTLLGPSVRCIGATEYVATVIKNQCITPTTASLDASFQYIVTGNYQTFQISAQKISADFAL